MSLIPATRATRTTIHVWDDGRIWRMTSHEEHGQYLMRLAFSWRYVVTVLHCCLQIWCKVGNCEYLAIRDLFALTVYFVERNTLWPLSRSSLTRSAKISRSDTTSAVNSRQLPTKAASGLKLAILTSRASLARSMAMLTIAYASSLTWQHTLTDWVSRIWKAVNAHSPSRMPSQPLLGMPVFFTVCNQ